MRHLLLLSFAACIAVASTAQAGQARRAAPPRAGLALTVTDPSKATLPNVTVEVSGPATAQGETDAAGQVSFPALQAGTFRVRFSAPSVVTFEREVALRAGQVTRLNIVLSPAPPAVAAPPPKPEPAAAPAPPPPPPVGPAGQPQVISIVDLVERALVKDNEPRRDTLVACSGNTRSMLVQLNAAQSTRVYEGAEAAYYVIAGEGAINVGGKDVALAAGGYAALPRGTAHAISRRGRRPLILLAVLSGEPCEEAR